MSTQSKSSYLQYLASISQDRSSFRTKLAACSLSTEKTSNIFGAIILTFEYLQLISQALLINPALYEDTSLNVIFKGVVYAAKLINPSFWMFMENNSTLTVFLIAGFLVLTMAKLLLFCYMMTFVMGRMERHSVLLALWKVIFQIQARVLCFFVTSFWVKAIILTSQNGSNISGMSETSLMVVSTAVIVLEFIFSLVLQDRYCYILPAKNFLAAKDNYLEMLTLIQKLIIQILQMTLQVITVGRTWIFTSLNIVFCLAREFHYFSTLPLYNLKALRYQGRLLSAVFSLNISYFMQNMIDSLGFSSGMRFIIPTWILLGLALDQISKQYLNRRELDLLKTPKKTSSTKFLLHKIIIINQLKKLQKLPSEYIQKNDFAFLMRASLQSNIFKALNADPKVQSTEESNIYSKENVNKMTLQYFDSLKSMFPKDKLVKLCIAYFYAKRLQLYGVAMKIIHKLQKDPSNKISLGAELLVKDIEVRAAKVHKNDYLDFHLYVISASREAKLNQKMLEQIELQTKLYNEVLDETPNLENIFQFSQKIHTRRLDITKRMHTLLSTIPEYYIRPLMVSALYHLSLDHSVLEYRRYRKKYYQMQEKYSKYFISEKLTQENLHQESNVFIMMSTEKGNAGNIVFCTKNIEQLYGSEAHLFIGTHIANVTPPTFRPYWKGFFDVLDTPEVKALFGVPYHTFGFHKQGYLVEVNFCLTVHPFMTGGFYYEGVSRPVPRPKSYILVHQNGDIEGATKEVSEKLGLLRSQRQNSDKLVNIRELSLEFSKIIEAFDIVEKLKKKQENKKDSCRESMSNVTEASNIGNQRHSRSYRKDSHKTEPDFDRLQELCSIFTSKGKDIQFNPLSNGSECNREKSHGALNYHCIMQDQNYERSSLKLIMLQEITGNESDLSSLQLDNTLEKDENQPPKSVEGEISASEVQAGEKVGSDRSDFFKIEDEKQSGWIDFTTLENKAGQGLLISTNTRGEQVDDPMLSPLSMDALMTYPKGQFVTESAKFVEKSGNYFDPKSKTTKNPNKWMTMKQNQIEIAIEASIGSQRSRTSQQKKTSSAYKLALSIKDVPTKFKVIAILFYALFLIVLVSQIAIKVKLDQAVVNLKTGKDIITLTEERSFRLASVQDAARLSFDLGTGKMNQSLFPVKANAMVKALQGNAIYVNTANQKMRIEANILSEDATKTLFQKNVRVYESTSDRALGKYENMTTFQAVDAIVEKALQAAEIMKINYSAAEKQVTYLIQNSMDDLLVKNDAISDTFLKNLQTEQESLDTVINDFMIVTTFFLVSAILILTCLIWKKYIQEQTRLLAVTKLNSEGILASLDLINHFKAVILDDVSAEDDIEGEQKETKQEAAAKQKAKRDNSKVPNMIGMRRRYYFYVARVWLLIIVFTGIAIGDCVSGRNSIAFFQAKQNQIYFANRLKSHVLLIRTTTQELLGSNGTTINSNQPVSTLIGELLDVLITMRDELASVFMNKDYTYDPEIKDILFVDACQYLEASLRPNCQNKKTQGQSTGLIYLLVAYQNKVQSKINAYKSSNKTTASLEQIKAKDYMPFVTDSLTIFGECNSISQITEAEFAVEDARAQKQRDVVLAILSALSVIIGGLAWIYILCLIRDSNRQFKTVLQAFPANLVLSSFVLKTFLIKTSKGALDFVKNSI